MRILVVGCYELGHQPLHVAGAAGHLRAAGHDVRAIDLSMQSWDPDLVDWADGIALSVPMHTAMRIARRAIEHIRARRPEVPVCAYGLYAGMLADVADEVLVGETDAALVGWADAPGRTGSTEPADEPGRPGPDPSVIGFDHPGDAVPLLGREAAAPGAPLPARDLLPPLDRYAHLALAGTERPVAYVEASHGCAHRCRHCPVPVVYDGRIRVVAVEDVLADVAQQVEAGARHVTFGDPDFLNGVHHSLRTARSLHERFPDLTFDCTVKVEHVLRHADLWPELADLGCLFVVSAFESVNDAILTRLDKGHTADDEARAVDVLRTHGIEVRPTWLPFTPWTTLADVQDILRFVAEHDLVGNVDPVQYTIRLLIPRGSLLLDLPEIRDGVGAYDPERGAHPWRAADPALDDLQVSLSALVERRLAEGASIADVFVDVCTACGVDPGLVPAGSTEGRPRLTEPWFC